MTSDDVDTLDLLTTAFDAVPEGEDRAERGRPKPRERWDASFVPRKREPRSLREALEDVSEHAGDEWQKQAIELIRETGEVLRMLTVDDVGWSRIPRPHDDRARGAAMQAAARAGHLARTDGYAVSRRPESHARPLKVWRSLVFDPEGPGVTRNDQGRDGESSESAAGDAIGGDSDV